MLLYPFMCTPVSSNTIVLVSFINRINKQILHGTHVPLACNHRTQIPSGMATESYVEPWRQVFFWIPVVSCATTMCSVPCCYCYHSPGLQSPSRSPAWPRGPRAYAACRGKEGSSPASNLPPCSSGLRSIGATHLPTVLGTAQMNNE